MTKHNYDWEYMMFDPIDDNVFTAFFWNSTPEGTDWWAGRVCSQDADLKKEVEERFKLMKRLYAEDMAAMQTSKHTKTLRDEFAMAALSTFAGENYPADAVATHAYAIADAMMKERNK